MTDAPFSYEEIATSELVEACRTFKIRLQSHTAGLLELTPTGGGGRIYRGRKDLYSVLFTKINFLHRTAQDFLLKNDAAKSFLALHGSNQAQVCFFIARDTLAQLAHFSPRDAQIVDNAWPNPMFWSFWVSLKHISIAERLLGATQAELMQSLDYESFASGYLVSEKPTSWYSLHHAFVITGRGWSSIDLVGMAAAVGMTIYVCERLDLSIESRRYSPALPDLRTYSRKIATTATLFWDRCDESRQSDTSLENRLRSPNNRQAIGKCLQWKVDARLSSRTAVPSKSIPLPETFQLSYYQPNCLDLVQILLRAGANPMVKVELSEMGSHDGRSETFWESWLEILLKLRIQYKRVNGRPGDSMLLNHKIRRFAREEIFDTTKELLAQGADITYQMRVSPLACYDVAFEYHVLRKGPFRLRLNTSAMSILEECFHTEPEFREFAVAMKPLLDADSKNRPNTN